MPTAVPRPWRSSTHSEGGRACVEVAPGPRGVLVRDSKDGGLGPILLLDQVAWRELMRSAVTRRPVAAGALRIAQDVRRTGPAGAEVVTFWHVTVAGLTLHFTDAEWVAFALGIREGEFDFAPVP
ncbi:MAG TPA: DUF397 domain-containing protein [Pseudonocardia sp.]|nr:DUF397 domain-containing protein [Pseudonocardia sp.]